MIDKPRSGNARAASDINLDENARPVRLIIGIVDRRKVRIEADRLVRLPYCGMRRVFRRKKAFLSRREIPAEGYLSIPNQQREFLSSTSPVLPSFPVPIAFHPVPRHCREPTSSEILLQISLSYFPSVQRTVTIPRFNFRSKFPIIPFNF